MHGFLKSRFPHTPYGSSVRNLNDIKNSLYAKKARGTVYSGAQARIVGLNKGVAHQAIYNRLSDKVYDYVNDGKIETQASFDDWHKDTCEMFISDCSKAGITVHYGMAQKFVNVLMKYVYCFDDSPSVDYSKFEYCHVALDGYTYYSPQESYQSKKGYNGYDILTPFYHRQVASSLVSHRTRWSKISTWQEYITIQRDIRDYFNTNPFTYDNVKHLDASHLASVHPTYKLTPFEAEFFIW